MDLLICRVQSSETGPVQLASAISILATFNVGTLFNADALEFSMTLGSNVLVTAQLSHAEDAEMPSLHAPFPRQPADAVACRCWRAHAYARLGSATACPQALPPDAATAELKAHHHSRLHARCRFGMARLCQSQLLCWGCLPAFSPHLQDYRWLPEDKQRVVVVACCQGTAAAGDCRSWLALRLPLAAAAAATAACLHVLDPGAEAGHVLPVSRPRFWLAPAAGLSVGAAE